MIEYMKESDKRNLFKFLEQNWNINHIYLKDMDYFEYEFSDKSNFVIAKKDDEIVATLGYFDYDNKGDIWTVIWKNSGKMDDGLKCLQFLLNAGYKSVSSCGINKKTIPIYEFLGIKTGRLKHFYILNPEIKDYKIAKISEKNIKKIVVGLPVNMNGRRGKRVSLTLEFVEKLKQRVDVPIIMQDERLTTVEADEILDESGVKKENRKQFIDMVAAGIILREYMEKKK